MPQVNNFLSLNKIALLVTTSLVLTGCNTVSPDNRSAGAKPAPMASETVAEDSKNGLSQNRLMRVADRAWKQGNPGTALRLYNMAAQKDPNATAPYLAMADILRKTKRADAAIDVYKGILKNHPDLIEAHTGVGYSLLTLEKPYLASQSFETAIALDPQNAKSLGGMGVALDTAGEHDKAQDYYRHAIKSDPNNLTYQNNLALSLALIGRVEQAIAMFEIITGHPDATAKHRQNLALVYGMAGKSADAMRYSRMDLSEKDARNNALYFQALNSDPTSDVAERAEQIYEMAALENASNEVAEESPQAVTYLATRTDPEILDTRTSPDIENTPRPAEPQQLIKQKQHFVEYAPDPAPAHLAVNNKTRSDDFMDDVAAAPVGTVDAQALIAPEKTTQAPVAENWIETSFFSGNLDMPERSEFVITFDHSPTKYLNDELEQEKEATLNPESSPEASDHLYFAQIGAFKTKERALNGWKILLKRHSDLLGDFKPLIARADLGPAKGGTFYRVRIGGFDHKTTPQDLCVTLRTRAQDCYMPRVSKVSSKKPVSVANISEPVQLRYNIASSFY